MGDDKNPQYRKRLLILWLGLIDIVALIADGTTISDWLHQSGLL